MAADSLTPFKIRIWFFVTFLIGAVEGIVGTFFPIIFVEKGGSLSSLGFIVAFVSLAGSLQIVWGKIIDTYRIPKLMSASSIVVTSVATGAMGASPTAGLFGGARVGGSVGTSVFNTTNSYLRSAYFPSTRRGRIGNIFMGMNLLGVTLGVFLAGLYYDHFGYDFSLEIHVIAAIVGLIAAILYGKFLPEFDVSLVKDEQLSFAMLTEKANLNYSFIETTKLVLSSKGLVPFIIGSQIFNFGVSISGPYFIVDLNDRWAFSNFQIASLMTFNSIVQVIVVFLFIPIIDIINRKHAFTTGIFLAILPRVGMLMSPSFVAQHIGSQFWFWMFIYGLSSIGWGLINAIVLTLLIDYVHPKIRGTVIGSYGSIQAILTFFGSLLAGILLQTIFTNTVEIFSVSILFRTIGFVILFFTPSAPIPISDFYEQRQIFLTKLVATMERGILWLPVVGKILVKKKDV
jgi:MFS family permease